MNGKRIILGAFGGAVAVTCAASVAWACTYQPRIFGLTAVAGAPGTSVTVSGQAAASQGQQVEIHWNGATGPKLSVATADAGGNFSVPVTIPAAAPDVYFIVAVAGTTGVARSAFEVTAPAPAARSSSAADTGRASQSDAWNGGFSQTRTSTSSAASVVDPAAQAGSTPGLAIGLGLLAGGGLVLGGLGVATARRRRATAQI